MKYVLTAVCLVVFIGCSGKNIEVYESNLNKKSLDEVNESSKNVDVNNSHTNTTGIDENLTKEKIVAQISKATEIYDLVNIPQDVNYYLQNFDNNQTFYNIQKKYRYYYFKIWNSKKPPEDLNSIKWPFNAYSAEKSYGENFQLLGKSFFDEMFVNSNFESFATINTKGITTKESSIRSFPTIRPLLMNPSIAGEGFPFDYLQNSSIHANEPILISHYSQDREWAYIFSNFASGWIKSEQFALMDEAKSELWQKNDQIHITKEGVSIYDEDGGFLFKSKVGMIFPLVSEDEQTYTVLTASSYKNSKPLYQESRISKQIASKDVLELNKNNLSKIISEVSKTNYGWGGIYEQRDCSSMMRDLFAPFGIWLPRNSLQQSRVGKVISLKNLTDKEKIEVIKKSAVPFQTLFYKKGHIVLYVGNYNDEIVVFHNVWGIKIKKDGLEGRIVIGKPIFSSLKLGAEQKDYDTAGEMLRNLKSINIITQ